MGDNIKLLTISGQPGVLLDNQHLIRHADYLLKYQKGNSCEYIQLVAKKKKQVDQNLRLLSDEKNIDCSRYKNHNIFNKKYEIQVSYHRRWWVRLHQQCDEDRFSITRGKGTSKAPKKLKAGRYWAAHVNGSLRRRRRNKCSALALPIS